MLEWFYQQAYYAAEGTAFDFSAFAQLTEQQQEQCSFQLDPSVKFSDSAHPVLSIWQINQGDTNDQQSLEPNSENYCIFRKNNQLEIVAIDTSQYKLLTLIVAEKTLKELATEGYEQQLPNLIQQGWVDGFKVNDV